MSCKMNANSPPVFFRYMVCLPAMQLRLLSSTDWSVVWRYALLPGEVSASVCAMHLCSKADGSMQPLVAVGTSFLVGEDYPCGGRILLFEVTKHAEQGWEGNLVYMRYVRLSAGLYWLCTSRYSASTSPY